MLCYVQQKSLPDGNVPPEGLGIAQSVRSARRVKGGTNAIKSLQARANGRRCRYRTRLTHDNGDDSPETTGARCGMSPSVTRWMRLW